MVDDFLNALPLRRGHFLLESGYHTDVWFSLDALFVSPREIESPISALADLFKAHDITAVCGPLIGGAFLAQSIAALTGLRFYFTQPAPLKNSDELFAAAYKLPNELRRLASDERFAIVDDCISAGSSVRATANELTTAGATVEIVGSLMQLGTHASDYFAERGIPTVTLARQVFNLWLPATCPICESNMPLENPSA